MHGTRSMEHRLPLSPLQEALWFIHELDPSDPSYNISFAMHFEGHVDAEAMRAAILTVVERHEQLRLRVVRDETGAPRAMVSERVDPSEIFDCINLSAADEGSADEVTRMLAARPFDLSREAPIRVRLLQRTRDVSTLVVVVHHIAFDRRSQVILTSEVLQTYQALARGHMSTVAPSTGGYAQYVAQEQARWSGVVGQQAEEFWRQYAQRTFSILELPRLQSSARRGVLARTLLAEAERARIATAAREGGAWTFIFHLAALQALLLRYGARRCVPIAVAMDTRTDAYDDTVSLFVNTVPVIMETADDPSFRQLIESAREAVLAILPYRSFPTSRVLGLADAAHSGPDNPLLRVLLSYSAFPITTPALEGVDVRLENIANGSAKADVFLEIIDSGPTAAVKLEGRADRLDQSMVDRMLEHWRSLIDGAIADPDRRVSELPLLTPRERLTILRDWNDTEVEFPADACVHHLFESQARRTPDAVAVVCDEEQLTYAQLNASANRLANLLRELGVREDIPVGIHLPRSLDAVVGILAALKAGGCYLPLDTEAPPQRIAFMLDDASAGVVLTRSDAAGDIPDRFHVVCMDADRREIEQHPDEDPRTPVSARNLVYVMYTSGSTGVPKGVGVEHRSVARLLHGVDYARLDRQTTMLHLAPLAFDASTLELWGPLLHGGRCVIVSQRLVDPSALRTLIEREGITTAWLTASLFNVIVDEDVDALARLRQLLIGGEALSIRHVRTALERLPHTRIINGYGPTECTTFTCCYPIPPEIPADEPIPIGRPIANTSIFVLDHHLNPVPRGVPGELYVGGPGVARGYLGRPALTASRFVPDPFSSVPGARLYATGDTVRFLPDSSIEFLGRMDQQVKIRGYRIELGEIEAVLREHPAVSDAAVVAVDRGGVRALVAYFTLKDAPPGQGSPGSRDAEVSTIGGLQELLRTRLPDYMVPHAFARLDALPKTQSGKVDRTALSSRPIDALDIEKSVAFDADPVTPTEERIAAVWADVLGSRVGMNVNFFDAGGNSLLLMRVHARLETMFEFQPSLIDLFRFPTVRLLAAHCEAIQKVSPVSVASVRPRRGRSRRARSSPAVHSRREGESNA